MAVEVYADAEGLVIGALDAALPEPVSTRAPADAGIRVLRTGGTRTKVTDRAQLTLEAYGKLETAASGLLARARSAVHALVGQSVAGWEVYRVEELGGPANLPDPRTTLARYTMSVLVHVRIHEEPS